MTEPIKAMAEGLAAIQFIEAQLLFENALPEKEHASLCKLNFVLRYNWDSVIIPH
jgi:hypothetical protein